MGFLLGVLLLLLAKLAYTHLQFDGPFLARPFWLAVNIGSVALPLLITLNFGSRLGPALATLMDLGLSLLLWGDLVYYRLFDDWPSLSLLAAAHQFGSTCGSFLEATQASDLLLFVDIPLLLTVLFRMAPVKRPPGTIFRFIPLALLSLLLVGLLSMIAFSIVRPQSLPSRLENSDFITYQGLLLFHGYDLLYHSSSIVQPPSAPPAAEVLPILRAAGRSVGPSVPHYAACRGSNVIFIQLESMESFPLNLVVEGQEVTPFLNDLVKSSLWAEPYDQTLQGSSSDGEFIYLNGLHPPTFGPLVFRFPSVKYRALPKILTDHGYLTQSAMPYNSRFWNRGHMDRAYGFESSLTQDAFTKTRDNSMDWGLKDGPLFQQYLEQLPDSERPFFSYLVTLMMHHPFPELPEQEKRLKLSDELEQKTIGRYLQLAAARDAAIHELVDGLRRQGLWDKTILVLAGDHRSRMRNEDKKPLSLPTSPDGDRVLLLIHCPGDWPKGKIERANGQLDFLPTLLHLLGIEASEAVFLGNNLLAPEREPVVARDWILGEKAGLRAGSSTPFRGHLSEVEAQEWQALHSAQRQAAESLIYNDAIYEALRLLGNGSELH